MNQNPKNLAILISRWIARVLVLAVLLLWGAFFVAHTHEWFIKPFPQLPPLKVCVFQTLHLLLLAGLLASLRWPRVGLICVTLAACAFFLPVAGGRALTFVGITILPVAFLVVCGQLKRTGEPRLQHVQ